MERIARLLPFRQFGRLRHLRGLASCAALNARASAQALTGSLFDGLPPLRGQSVKPDHPANPATAAELPVLPSAQPAFARVSLHNTLNHADPARRAPVRVYHGPSRLIMVGTIDAVCRMIDRCIAEQQADAVAAAAK
jgi:hypothetical protein